MLPSGDIHILQNLFGSGLECFDVPQYPSGSGIEHENDSLGSDDDTHVPTDKTHIEDDPLESTTVSSAGHSTKAPVTGVDPRVIKHAMEVHGFSDAQEHRTYVLGKVIAEGPQPIPAQVLRTRLDAWKKTLSDKAFTLGVCACEQNGGKST